MPVPARSMNTSEWAWIQKLCKLRSFTNQNEDDTQGLFNKGKWARQCSLNLDILVGLIALLLHRCLAVVNSPHSQ